MVKSYLLENYGYNEPVSLNELSIEGLSENAVRQSVKRLVANGFLERYDNGIYYIPKQGGLLGKSYLDSILVVMRKYVRSRTETYGYVTGLSFANQLGITTQMPAVIEVVSNRESTNGRVITVGNTKVRIKNQQFLFQRIMQKFYSCWIVWGKLKNIQNCRWKKPRMQRFLM